MDELKTRVITNARRILADSDVSQRELARRAGVSYSALRRYLDVREDSMTSRSMWTLARVLGVDVHALTEKP